MENVVLSIDCGTQSLRAILFSLKGKLLAIERISFEPYTSPKPGWAEQNPEIYWTAVKTACRNLQNEYPKYFSRISGVGVSALRDSMVNVDKNGKPLRPLMVWLDQRKARPVYKPNATMKLIIKYMGLTDTLAKAQREGKGNWIQQNQPDIWADTWKYLQVSGFLNYRLTGEFKDSVAAQIGHIPFDYKKQKWGNPRGLFNFSTKLYPVEKGKLPELISPGKIFGGNQQKCQRRNRPSC